MQTMGTFKDPWKSDPGMDSLGWIGPAGALSQTFGLAGTAPIDVSTYPWQEKNDQAGCQRHPILVAPVLEILWRS